MHKKGERGGEEDKWPSDPVNCGTAEGFGSLTLGNQAVTQPAAAAFVCMCSCGGPADRLIASVTFDPEGANIPAGKMRRRSV